MVEDRVVRLKEAHLTRGGSHYQAHFSIVDPAPKALHPGLRPSRQFEERDDDVHNDTWQSQEEDAPRRRQPSQASLRQITQRASTPEGSHAKMRDGRSKDMQPTRQSSMPPARISDEPDTMDQQFSSQSQRGERGSQRGSSPARSRAPSSIRPFEPEPNPSLRSSSLEEQRVSRVSQEQDGHDVVDSVHESEASEQQSFERASLDSSEGVPSESSGRFRVRRASSVARERTSPSAQILQAASLPGSSIAGQRVSHVAGEEDMNVMHDGARERDAMEKKSMQRPSSDCSGRASQKQRPSAGGSAGRRSRRGCAHPRIEAESNSTWRESRQLDSRMAEEDDHDVDGGEVSRSSLQGKRSSVVDGFGQRGSHRASSTLRKRAPSGVQASRADQRSPARGARVDSRPEGHLVAGGEEGHNVLEDVHQSDTSEQPSIQKPSARRGSGHDSSTPGQRVSPPSQASERAEPVPAMSGNRLEDRHAAKAIEGEPCEPGVPDGVDHSSDGEQRPSPPHRRASVGISDVKRPRPGSSFSCDRSPPRAHTADAESRSTLHGSRFEKHVGSRMAEEENHDVDDDEFPRSSWRSEHSFVFDSQEGAGSPRRSSVARDRTPSRAQSLEPEPGSHRGPRYEDLVGLVACDGATADKKSVFHGTSQSPDASYPRSQSASKTSVEGVARRASSVCSARASVADGKLSTVGPASLRGRPASRMMEDQPAEYEPRAVLTRGALLETVPGKGSFALQRPEKKSVIKLNEYEFRGVQAVDYVDVSDSGTNEMDEVVAHSAARMTEKEAKAFANRINTLPDENLHCEADGRDDALDTGNSCGPKGNAVDCEALSQHQLRSDPEVDADDVSDAGTVLGVVAASPGNLEDTCRRLTTCLDALGHGKQELDLDDDAVSAAGTEDGLLPGDGFQGSLKDAAARMATLLDTRASSVRQDLCQKVLPNTSMVRGVADDGASDSDTGTEVEHEAGNGSAGHPDAEHRRSLAETAQYLATLVDNSSRCASRVEGMQEDALPSGKMEALSARGVCFSRSAAEVGNCSGAAWRADCRYTKPSRGVGAGLQRAILPLSRGPELADTERTRVTMLIERTDKLVQALRSQDEQQLTICKTSFNRVCTELTSELALYVRGFLEGGPGNIHGVHAAILLFVRCVELLDVVIAFDESACAWDAGLSSLSNALGADAVAKTLSESFGHRDIVGLCVECIAATTCQAVAVTPHSHPSAELHLHAVMALNLMLTWKPAKSYGRTCSPCESFLATGGYEVLVKVLLGCSLCGSRADAGMDGSLSETCGHIALVIDTLRLGLWGERGTQKLVEQLEAVRESGSPSRRSSQRGMDSNLPLAALSLQFLSEVPDLAVKAEVVDGSVMALRAALDLLASSAIHLIVALYSVPPEVAHAICPPQKVAHLVKDVLQSRPLTIRLASAVRALVSQACRRRFWRMDPRSTSQDLTLRSCLVDSQIASDCVQSLMLATGTLAGSSNQVSPSVRHAEGDVFSPDSLEATAAEIAERARDVSFLCRHVEEVVRCLHGCSDLMRLLEKTANECGAGEGDSLRDGAIPRPSLLVGLAQIRRGLRTNCLLPPFRRSAR